MNLSRRELLSASALLLAGPGAAWRAALGAAATGTKPIVLCWNENPYGPSPAARAAARMTTPNVFAVRAARASLGDTAFLADTRKRILASRVRITTELARRQLAYAEPQGNFVFFDTGMPLKRFTELMRARNILVGRRFAPFDNWCRITIGRQRLVRHQAHAGEGGLRLLQLTHIQCAGRDSGLLQAALGPLKRRAHQRDTGQGE
jgi:histidinol-phosphate/aromatic aminotransferase/cobyric acid decarboxylase-like protein